MPSKKTIIIAFLVLSALIVAVAATVITNTITYTQKASHAATITLVTTPGQLTINTPDTETAMISTQTPFTGYFKIWIFNVTNSPASLWNRGTDVGGPVNLDGVTVNGTFLQSPSPDGAILEFAPFGPYAFKNGSTITYSFCLCDNGFTVADGTSYQVQISVTS